MSKRKTPTPKRSHKSKDVPIKSAQIDEQIIPLIQWMNKVPGLFTRWSCQGSPKKAKDEYRAYICFYCEDLLTLSFIVRRLMAVTKEANIHCPSVTVDMYEDMPRFTIEASHTDLQALSHVIEAGNPATLW